MLHRISIGLDAHARGIVAAAFIPETGEVCAETVRLRRRRGRLLGEGPAAAGAVRLRIGSTGFDLKRKLDESGVECLVGAVSKMILGVLSVSVVTPAPVAVASSAVAIVGTCALPVAHAGVLAFPFACIDSVLRKQIAQLSHAHRGAFFR